MSGLEVVGVVLGAIPLIISALEHYADGVSTIKSMREYENVFVDSQTRLHLSLAMFRQSCRELVRDLPDGQTRDLVDLRKGWDDAELKSKLERRLGDDYGVYRMSIRQLNKRIDRLRQKLRLQEDLTVPFIVGGAIDEKLQKDFFKSTWSRIRGGFNAERHKQLVGEIRSDIDQICAFTKGAIDIEDVTSKQSSQKASGYWLQIRSHTYGLYDALAAIWSKSCTSHTHLAKLQLCLPKEDKTVWETPQFKLSFSLNDNLTPSTSLPWESRGVTVQSFRPVKSTTPKKTVSTHAGTTKSKKIVFNLPPSLEETHESKISCSSNAKIDNLCTTLVKSCHQESCSGFLAGEEWHYHIHGVVSQNRRSLTPLTEILHSQQQRPTSTKQKRTIALALASGVLQLYNTPWLEDRWTVSDIYMDTTQGYEHLYVIKTFNIPDPNQQQARRDTNGDEELLVKNRTLFALGVALLELNYGAPLSQLQTIEDLNDKFTEYRAATRLTRMVQDDELPRFASAVAKCIYPTADGCDFSFANEGFRRRFFEDVVVPLKEDYEALFWQLKSHS